MEGRLVLVLGRDTEVTDYAGGGIEELVLVLGGDAEDTDHTWGGSEELHQPVL